MCRKRKYTDYDLIRAVQSSISIREVLGKIGKSQQGGGSYYQIKKDIARLELSISHFLGKGHLKGKRCTWSKIEKLDSILVRNSTYTNRYTLKIRLFRENKLKNACSICGLSKTWNWLPITLILDHINGIHNDNRLENLRILCPNCNSQQKTFAGRNRKAGLSELAAGESFKNF